MNLRRKFQAHQINVSVNTDYKVITLTINVVQDLELPVGSSFSFCLASDSLVVIL